MFMRGKFDKEQPINVLTMFEKFFASKIISKETRRSFKLVGTIMYNVWTL